MLRTNRTCIHGLFELDAHQQGESAWNKGQAACCLRFNLISLVEFIKLRLTSRYVAKVNPLKRCLCRLRQALRRHLTQTRCHPDIRLTSFNEKPQERTALRPAYRSVVGACAFQRIGTQNAAKKTKTKL